MAQNISVTMPDARLVDSKATFTQFGHILDARILRALADLGFARPTLVQTKAIPLALENRDILARARTGSGKTAAYCIPLVQKVLNAKSVRLHCSDSLSTTLSYLISFPSFPLFLSTQSVTFIVRKSSTSDKSTRSRSYARTVRASRFSLAESHKIL